MTIPQLNTFLQNLNWTSLLWRELCGCQDKKYASRLFELIINQPVSWGSTVGLMVLGALISAGLGDIFISLLQGLSLISMPDYEHRFYINLFLTIIAGSIGAGLILTLRLLHELSWNGLFNLLVTSSPLRIRHYFDSQAFYFKLIVAIGGGVGAACINLIRYDYSARGELFYVSLILAYLAVVLIFSPLLQRIGCSAVILGWIILLVSFVPMCLIVGVAANKAGDEIGVVVFMWLGAVAGGLIALLMGAYAGTKGITPWGLATSFILGIGLGSFITLILERQTYSLILARLEMDLVWKPDILLGIAAAGLGIYLGRGSGLVRLLKGQIILVISAIITGAIFLSNTWLAGILVGSVLGWFSQVFWPSRSLSFSEVYAYRRLYFWWFNRPFAGQVEAALRRKATSPLWVELFQHLDKPDQQPDAIETTGTKALLGRDWRVRFIARARLVTAGSKALPLLASWVAKNNPPGATPLAAWLLRSIGYETRLRLAGEAQFLICSNCFTCCGAHPVSLRFGSVHYYGCRTCGQSHHFLKRPRSGKVVAVLDTAIEGFNIDSQGNIRVNWFSHQALFDFDQVEIVQAGDEAVERFAIQVGNDTDGKRRSQYKQMRCLVTDPRLSANTLRILQHLFGRVERPPLSFQPAAAN